jgi:hypothetical protein
LQGCLRCGRQLLSCPGAATDGEPVIIYGDPVRKEDAKIVFVLRDGKYYLAEFWCVSDRRVVTAEFDPWRANNRRTTRSAAQLPVDSYDPHNRVIRTIGSDEVVHDAASIEGGVFTRSTNSRANNPATQSEVDGGASLGSP